jgi:hypothetical protein
LIESEQTPNPQTSKIKGSKTLLPINKMELKLVIQATLQEIPLQFFYPISNTDRDREERKYVGRLESMLLPNVN